jgi:hypothetical protein
VCFSHQKLAAEKVWRRCILCSNHSQNAFWRTRNRRQQLNTQHLHQRGDGGLNAWHQYHSIMLHHLPHLRPSEFTVYKLMFHWDPYDLLLACDIPKKFNVLPSLWPPLTVQTCSCCMNNLHSASFFGK